MSEGLAAVRAAAVGAAGRDRLDTRRKLQLALSAAWLFDGLLQYQPAMFSKSFPQMLAGSAAGNPAPVAAPIVWSATFIGHHLVISNGVFATIQVLLGLGIAWRPTVKAALAASVVWSAGVWWLGEGLGGILTGSLSPLAGAPGAVVLYALLAVLLWPADRHPAAPFVAARAVGTRVAQASCLILWGTMAVLALLSGIRAPGALSDSVLAMSHGQPGWLAWLDARFADALAGHGLAASIVLAVLLLAVAVGPWRAALTLTRAALVLAIALAMIFWLAEGTGGVLTGTATDPNTGPLLILIAVAFWPLRVSTAKEG